MIKNSACAVQAQAESKLLVHTETLLEAVNTSACINKLLLTGVERMALGADFNSDVLLSGTGLDHITACAGDSGLNVVGMNSFFLYCGTSLSSII